MSLDLINAGAEANDGTGDPPRVAALKMNAAIAALEAVLATLEALPEVATSGDYADLEGLPFIPAGFTYDQQAEPLSPTAGQTWRERSAGGLTLGIWEWSGSLWLSTPKISTGISASISGASSTFLSPLDYNGNNSIYVLGTHFYISTVASTGNLILQMRGLRADGAGGAELGSAFYSSGPVASAIASGYQSIEQLVTAPNVFAQILATYTRTVGSGTAIFHYSTLYRNVR